MSDRLSSNLWAVLLSLWGVVLSLWNVLRSLWALLGSIVSLVWRARPRSARTEPAHTHDQAPLPGAMVPVRTALDRLRDFQKSRVTLWREMTEHWPGWLFSILFHALLIALSLLFVAKVPVLAPKFFIVQSFDDNLHRLIDIPLEEVFKDNPVDAEFDQPPDIDAHREDATPGYNELSPHAPDYSALGGNLTDLGRAGGGGDHLAGKAWDSSGTGIIGDRSQAGRREGVRARGGSAESEKAVEAALKWLAAHQDDDGKWNYIDFVDHCPLGDSCGGSGSVQHNSLPGGANIGVTGLTFLTFLAAGSTPREGAYQNTSAKALNWLLSQQNERSGAFNAGQPRTSMYNQAIATLALAECYTMTKDPRLHPRLIRAIGFLNQSQQRDGGWDYLDLRTNRNDTSVTGWAVMAYKSIRAAGIDIPAKTISGIRRHFDRVTNDSGYTGYTDATSSSRMMALHAVGMLSLLYMGQDRSSPLLHRQADLLLNDLPAWSKLRGPNGRNHTMYYWYYGTLAMYQMGGREWSAWNPTMRDMLVANQCTRGHRAGSWDPDDYWSEHYAGRVFSTALCTLNLEIYYRYLPLYQQPENLGMDVALADEIDKETDPAVRVKLLRRMLSLSRPEVEATLIKLLNDPDPSVRFVAAKELAERGDPAAIPFLTQALDHRDDFVRFGAIRALGHIEDIQTIPLLIRALSDTLPGNADLAAESLRAKTGQNFDFKADFTPEDKSRIIAAWKTWWEAHRESLAAEPPVLARVLASRDGGTRVLLRLVDGGPFKTGMRLSVYRAGSVAGYVRIEQVMEGGMAEASTLKWLLQKPIQSDDQLRNLAAARKEAAS